MRVGYSVKLWRADYADVGDMRVMVMPQSAEPVELWITWEDHEREARDADTGQD